MKQSGQAVRTDKTGLPPLCWDKEIKRKRAKRGHCPLKPEFPAPQLAEGLAFTSEAAELLDRFCRQRPKDLKESTRHPGA